MLLRSLLRHQQEDHQFHGLAIGCIERNRLGEPDERRNGFLQSLDAAVRNCDALTEPGRPETFTREKTIEHLRMRDAASVLEEQPDLLESALLARSGKIDQHV